LSYGAENWDKNIYTRFIIDILFLIELFSYQALLILPFLGLIGMPIPEESILLLCGYLIATHIVEPVPALITVYTGILITDFIIFYIMKRYGRSIVKHKLFSRIISAEKISAIENKFQRFGPVVIILCRQVYGLRTQAFVASGLMGLSNRTFIITDAFAAFCTLSIVVTLGYLGVQQIHHLHPDFLQTKHIVFILCIVITGYILLRFLQAKHNSKNNYK